METHTNSIDDHIKGSGSGIKDAVHSAAEKVSVGFGTMSDLIMGPDS